MGLNLVWCPKLNRGDNIKRAGYGAPRTYTESLGQPQFYMSRNQLEFLVELNLSGSQITNLGVSEQTI